MREDLAESLLATVMSWTDEDVAEERPALQAFADYKYDEYEQYQPGRRFIESLAHWLDQFQTLEERRTAYKFVRERLVFISRAEMDSLVASVYPDFVRPLLVRRAAADLELDSDLVRRVSEDQAFYRRHRGCLFVGLSDGARTSVLRRTNPRISNEQVVADYSALPQKAAGLVDDLREDLSNHGSSDAASAKFTTVVLLDDLSASGISYVRPDVAGKGKVSKVAESLRQLGELLDLGDLEVLVMLYVATEQALTHLRDAVAEIQERQGGMWTVAPVQRLSSDLVIGRGEDPELDAIIEKIYDPMINDKHMQKGGTDGRYGFADCGLPLVLAHNTPNNSLAVLWAETERVRGLFPRVSRHREDS